MIEMFNNLMGDVNALHVDDNVLYVVIALVVLFVIGEMFNILRTVLNFAFGKK